MSVLPTLTPPDPDDDPATFDADAYAFFLALSSTWAAAFDLAIQSLNLNATNDTSTTSNAIGSGAKTFTVSASKSFVGGMFLVIADSAAPSTNWMLAQVTSYSGTSLVVNSLYTGGSGTKTSWVISQCAYLPASIGDHEVTVHTGNGMGSTNNKIRRFATTARSVGTAITYADSATDGASFTINEAGLYEIFYADEHTAGQYSGVTLNSAQLTTAILSTTVSTRISIGVTNGAGNAATPATRTVRLAAADVVRPHAATTFTGTTAGLAIFSIRKVGL
jgi:hypothetical protein